MDETGQVCFKNFKDIDWHDHQSVPLLYCTNSWTSQAA